MGITEFDEVVCYAQNNLTLNKLLGSVPVNKNCVTNR